MEIPIMNIYYLLSYAWNKLAESKMVAVDRVASDSLFDLLAKVLVGGMHYLIRLGLDRNYVAQVDRLSRIRGKIDFSLTLQRTFFAQPAVYCFYDDLNHDILHNQIIKTTLDRLRKYPLLDNAIRHELNLLYRRLSDVRTIPLRKRHFGMVQLHSNNAFYEFLLNICELIHDLYLPSEGTGTTRFRDFLRDQGKMALLFEAFVRNFYAREQHEYKVSRIDIEWNVPLSDENLRSFLPKMQTDIFLDSPGRKMIIDTKYYRETLNFYHSENGKIHSDNLFQMFAYLKNIEAKGPAYHKCEGILLYPTTSVEYDIYLDNFHGHSLRIKTVNLNQPWQDIHRELLRIIA